MKQQSNSGRPKGRLSSRSHVRPEATSPQPKLQDSARLLDLFRPDLSGALSEQGAPSYRYKQVVEHLVHGGTRPFSQTTTLPAGLRARLEGLGTSSLTVAARRMAPDGTVKLLLATRDGSRIETVIMRYQKRTTVCISSQVGCPVGCRFCATGAAGFRRNLTPAEIVDQVRIARSVAAESGGRVSNVVFMGMGEPLLNLQAVASAIRILTDPLGFSLGHRSISVSTVGIPAGIVRLGRLEPQVNLAVSLHAATDDVRRLLIPERYLHSVEAVLEAAWEHFALTRRKVMIEYVLLRGVNDSVQDAVRLASLLRGHVVTVNLLTWNPVAADTTKDTRGRSGRTAAIPAGAKGRTFQPSSLASMMAFRDALADAHIEVVVRESRGAEIEAACGQLAGKPRSY